MWEYKVVGFHGTIDEFGPWLNEQGAGGWELVCYIEYAQERHFVFKAPKFSIAVKC